MQNNCYQKFTLLSEDALKHILSCDSMSSKNRGCVKLIKSVSAHKESLFKKNQLAFIQYIVVVKFILN